MTPVWNRTIALPEKKVEGLTLSLFVVAELHLSCASWEPQTTAASERQGLTETACAVLVYQKNLDFWGFPLKLIFSVCIIMIMDVCVGKEGEEELFK